MKPPRLLAPRNRPYAAIALLYLSLNAMFFCGNESTPLNFAISAVVLVALWLTLTSRRY